MADGSNLSDALAFEKNRFMKLVSEAAVAAQTEVGGLKQQLAAKGLAISGNRYSGEIEIRLGKIGSVVEKRIALRRELGCKVPELLEEYHLKTLKNELEEYINSGVAGCIQYLSMPPNPGGAVREALRGHAERQAGSIKAKVANELAALTLEARLGLCREEKPVATINISHSTIASLNLGTVFGDLNASIQTLTGQGQEGLADVVRRLTEAIIASKELENTQQKELLEHLSFVSAEAALPPERRRMGPLKSSIVFLQTSLNTVAQLASLWSAAEHALKAVGILSS